MYDLPAILQKIASMEKSDMTYNTACIEAIKTMYPKDFQEMTAICKQQGIAPETAIIDLIQFLANEQGIKTEPEKLVMPKKHPGQKREGLDALLYMAAQGKKLSPCIMNLSTGGYFLKYPYKNEYERLKAANPQARISDTAHFTADIETIKMQTANGVENWKFIPADNGLFCLDIDAKEGKENGLKELLKVFDPQTLPDELTDIEGNFPFYVETPNNGYHLYFKYTGPPIKGTKLFPGIETKHGSPGLTSPGSTKEGKPYILHGELKDAPPLFGLILDCIQKRGLIKTETKEPPQKAAADRVTKSPARAWTDKPRITMDGLAAETSGGNHDRQVQFAGKCCRCKFSFADCLSYVKANPVIFGSGADTESTIKSVYNDNGGI